MWGPGPTSALAGNPIQAENLLPGSTGWVLTNPAQHSEISGYPSRESVYPGQAISFSVRTLEPRFSAAVYRIGWYGGAGGRLMRTIPSVPGHIWPIPKPNRRTGLLDARWPASFTIQIPLDWISGMYLVKLTDSLGYQTYIPFTLVEAQPRSPLLLVDSVATSEAYNTWGGTSLYADINRRGSAAQFAHRAVMVSFLRPFQQSAGAGWFLSWEIHAVRWLEQNGYWVSYVNDLDVNDRPSLLLGRKGVILAGHDEYWTVGMRGAIENAIAHGVGLANLAANTSFWQIRLAPLGSSPDGVEICYKDFKRDPIHSSRPKLATIEWRMAPVNRPESTFLGAMYGDFQGKYGPFPWVVTAPKSWVFAGAGVSKGFKVKGLVGHEEDTLVRGYPRPRGLTTLSASPVFNSAHRRRVSNATVYRAASGAIVFNAGTIDWSYGLDTMREWYWAYSPARSKPSPLVEKVTANVLQAMLAG